MRFHLGRKDGNIIHWLNNNYRTITKILIYVPVIVICPIYFLNSPIYELLSHPTTEIIVTTPKQNQETYNNDSSLGFDNGWIPNSLILEHKEMQINSLSKNINKTIQSKRYQPSITSYPFTMLQNVSSPLYSNDSDNSSSLNGDVILFWHIPKAAGSTVKQVWYRYCHQCIVCVSTWMCTYFERAWRYYNNTWEYICHKMVYPFL